MSGAATADLAATLGLVALPLLAGLLVLASHVPLGMQVLARGIVFIDLAIAQVAGLGAMAGALWGVGVAGLPAEGVAAGLLVQAAAVGAALAGAGLLTWVERRAPRQQEALIGVGFVLAACTGLLLLSGHPHAGEQLQALLVGQILWVGWPQIGVLAAVTAALGLGRALGLGARMGRFGFYAAFAVAVTASVQLVGVYLVFASLILPALGTARMTGPRRTRRALGLGALGYALGLAASALWDLPSGAVVVWALALCAAAVAAGVRPSAQPVAAA